MGRGKNPLGIPIFHPAVSLLQEGQPAPDLAFVKDFTIISSVLGSLLKQQVDRPIN